MAYRILINNRWVLCNQEDNEILCDLSFFLADYINARYPGSVIPSVKEKMTICDHAIMRWCANRNINLDWIARPNELGKPGTLLGGYGREYLLVFNTPADAMLFKLSFNSDSRADR